MQRSPAANFLQFAFFIILTSTVLMLVLAENLKTFKNNSQRSIDTTNHPNPLQRQHHAGPEGALAMTYRTPPALEATPLPPGVQLIPVSAPAVHPHDTQGGEMIRASKLMTTEEEKFEDNSRNKIPTVNDASTKTSASTAGVELSLPLTTTTTTIANDCLQALTSGVLSLGRCGSIFFFFWSSILFSTTVTLRNSST